MSTATRMMAVLCCPLVCVMIMKVWRWKVGYWDVHNVQPLPNMVYTGDIEL
ncbi:hypothetical protein FD19_GL001633 [Lacticaseibacillus thailandensis DSM 22698 = JCM 13996]|uniref:Uncharacterized protein n=1 Tax=Lacticaseibacillus thailandensis DSM 22698 = JCM 13996 TaxID=1423810 RepID=A0A0R2C601_9LACO|nr:hypothetical protein FD19_GL001633 [Lacticaseibacillus thailandensis DSM 22698 = JCM 13996]